MELIASKERAGALVGVAVAAAVGGAGIVGTTLGLIVGDGQGDLLLVAFAPWGDRDLDRATLWSAGAPIAAEWAGSTFVIDASGIDPTVIDTLPALIVPLGRARVGCPGSRTAKPELART